MGLVDECWGGVSVELFLGNILVASVEKATAFSLSWFFAFPSHNEVLVFS